MEQIFSIATSGGSFPAYVARPQQLPAPVVVVIHEVFGVNADMRTSCDELAAQGYIAICPDLFWRVAPGIELSDKTEAENAQAVALYNSFDIDAGVEDIKATVHLARHMPGGTGKVGVLGFCLGGLLAFLVASRIDADAVVAYYPGNADRHLGEAPQITTPMVVHLAEMDEYIPSEARTNISSAVQGTGKAVVYTYPDCHHAFARHNGHSYDAQAAVLASARTAAFLAHNLRAT